MIDGDDDENNTEDDNNKDRDTDGNIGEDNNTDRNTNNNNSNNDNSNNNKNANNVFFYIIWKDRLRNTSFLTNLILFQQNQHQYLTRDAYTVIRLLLLWQLDICWTRFCNDWSVFRYTAILGRF